MHIFFHVPKAAGTSFREMLRHEISAQKVLMLQGAGGLAYITDDMLNGMDLISGHIGINLLKRINRPFISVSILREPISRVVSQYRYLRYLAQQKDALSAQRDAFFKKSLEELLRDVDYPVVESTLRNTQTWLFASDWQAPLRDFSLSHEEVLARAKANLERLDFFGIVEELDLTYRAMNRKFHWGLLNDFVLNRTEGEEVKLDPGLVEQIILNNHLDVELYAWAKKRFFEKCEQILAVDRFTIRPNNFSGVGWMNGIRTEGGKNTFYFLSPRNEQSIVKVGDSLVFNKTGHAKITKVETIYQNSKLSVFVTVDHSLDPEGDGFPNRVLVHSGDTRST